MYKVEIALNSDKSIMVYDLEEIRVFEEESLIWTVKPENFFDFFWIAGRRYSFVGRQNASIVKGEDIAHISFFPER